MVETVSAEYLRGYRAKEMEIDRLSLKKVPEPYIKEALQSYYSVQWPDIASGDRRREIVIIRQLYAYLCREFTPLSLKTIARNSNQRDHSCVIHSVRTVKDLMDTDEDFRNLVLTLKKLIHDNYYSPLNQAVC